MKPLPIALGAALVLSATTACTSALVSAMPIAAAILSRVPVEPIPADDSRFAPFNARILELVNQERAGAGLSPLASHPGLQQAAAVHATNMATRQHLAHTIDGIEQHSLTMRAVYAGYEFTRITENLASGIIAAEDLVAGWLRSPGHRANIFDPEVKESGVAVSRGANGVFYYCQVFAVQHPYAGR